MESNGDYEKRNPFRFTESQGAIRHAWFITAAGPGATAYPSEGSSPNVYYARRVRNPSYAQTVGQQEVTYSTTTEYAHVCNLEAEKYIEEGSLIKCWHENGRWWTIDKTRASLLFVGMGAFPAFTPLVGLYNPTTGDLIGETLSDWPSTSGNVVLARTGQSGAVWTLGPSGLRKWSRAGTLLWGKAGGVSMAVDASGNAYVNSGTTITKRNSSGDVVATLSTGDVSDGFIATDVSGNLFYHDENTVSNRGLVKFDSSGSELWSTATIGGVTGSQFKRRIAIDASGSTYVASRKIDQSGSVLWTNPGTGGFDDFCVCIDADGGVYVGEPSGTTLASHVRKISPSDGSTIWSTEVSSAAESRGVRDLAAHDGAVYAVCPRTSGLTKSVYRLNAATGSIEWSANTSSRADTVAPPRGVAPIFQ